LEEINLFAGLPASALEQLDDITRIQRYDADQLITLEGDAHPPIFFILEGTIRIFRSSPQGREQTLILLRAGDAFNIPTAFAGTQEAPASTMAVEEASLLVADPADFRRVTIETPPIARCVLRHLSDQLRHFAGLTHNLSLRTVRGRLAHFLLQEALQHGPEQAGRWTHAEIAARIGTVREVVSRTMRTFMREGLIKVERHRIVIPDPEALRKQVDE
jgi:CRP/FNR family transcriptional regulator